MGVEMARLQRPTGPIRALRTLRGDVVAAVGQKFSAAPDQSVESIDAVGATSYTVVARSIGGTPQTHVVNMPECVATMEEDA